MVRYGISVFGMNLTAVLGSVFCVLYILNGSTRLHDAVFKVIFHAPMEFFDTTPLGRIVNRMTKDVDEIDNFLPYLAENTTRNVLRSVAYIVFIGIGINWMLLGVIPVLLIFAVAGKYFMKVFRNIKRMENVTRSPVFSYISTSAQGLITLRAFKKQQVCTQHFYSLIDQNLMPLMMFHAVPRMFGIYLDFVCLAMILSTCCTAVALRDTIPASISALCILFSARVSC